MKSNFAKKFSKTARKARKTKSTDHIVITKKLLENVFKLAKIGVPMVEIYQSVGVSADYFRKSEALKQAYYKGESSGLVQKTNKLFKESIANSSCTKIWFDRYDARSRARLNGRFNNKTLLEKIKILEKTFEDDEINFEIYERILKIWREKYEFEMLITELTELKNNINILSGEDIKLKIQNILSKIEDKKML